MKPHGTKRVPGFNGYCVTDAGVVFSQHVERNGGPLLPNNPWVKLTGRKPDGKMANRISFRLKRDDGKQVGMQCGVIVLLSWIGVPPAGLECCHNDGDPLNNHLENLRWDTRKANAADRLKHGTDQFGEKNASAILKESQVRFVKSSDKSSAELARKFGVCQSTISGIRAGRSWRHVK